jgi:small subunit ribosomal protein S27Ae
MALCPLELRHQDAGRRLPTDPKKRKHKKKKVPLAVLKFYKVDDSGAITRTRMECPHPDCGAGVFMAAHKDRQYCGKCGLTYVFQKEGAE